MQEWKKWLRTIGEILLLALAVWACIAMFNWFQSQARAEEPKTVPARTVMAAGIPGGAA